MKEYLFMCTMMVVVGNITSSTGQRITQKRIRKADDKDQNLNKNGNELGWNIL